MINKQLFLDCIPYNTDVLNSVVKVFIEHINYIFQDNQRFVSYLYNKETLKNFQSL